MIADLRLRLIAALVVVGCLSQIAHLPAALAALAAAAMLAWGKIRLRRLLHLEAFLVLLLIMLPLTVPGRPLATIGPFALSAEGGALALLVGVKVTAAALLLAALLGGVDPLRLGAALSSLRVPEPLVRVFILAPRYLGLIGAEARRLRLAMRARGFRPGTNLHTLRSYGNLIGMLLLRGLDRARRVEEAMRMRGFSGRFVHMHPARPGARDWAAALALGFGAALILVLDRL